MTDMRLPSSRVVCENIADVLREELGATGHVVYEEPSIYRHGVALAVRVDGRLFFVQIREDDDEVV